MLGLSFVGLAMGQIVSLYRMGILRRLPDIPLWPFNATRVDAAPYAYKRLQTPDGVLMIGTYAVTAALVAVGGRDRAARSPALPLLLAAKTALRQLHQPQARARGVARHARVVRLLPDRLARLLRARAARGLALPRRPALTGRRQARHPLRQLRHLRPQRRDRRRFPPRPARVRADHEQSLATRGAARRQRRGIDVEPEPEPVVASL